MAFPLTGSVLSHAVSEVVVGITTFDTISSYTYIWNGTDNSYQTNSSAIFPRVVRSRVVSVVLAANTLVESIEYYRRWGGGLGGTIYLPTFPQWDNEQTLYPFAY